MGKTYKTDAPENRLAADAWLAIVRIVIGVIFLERGAQKLFGAYDGPGLASVVSTIGPIGYWVAAAEFFGGPGLIVGVLSRLSAASLIGVTVGSLGTVHGGHGLLLGNVGFPFDSRI